MAHHSTSRNHQFYRSCSVALLGILITFSARISPEARAQEASPFSSLLEFAEEKVTQQVVAGGSILIMHRGEVIFHEGFGYSDLKTQTPFAPDENVVLASISKPMLATALFHLAQEGRLDLNTSIDHYLPEFLNSKLAGGKSMTRLPNTIELISHTSGALSYYSEGGRPWLNPWTKAQSLASVVNHYSKELQFQFVPGTSYAYSGIGTDIAARVGEVSSGLPRNDLLQLELAKPLGLIHTGYRDMECLPESMPSKYYLNSGSGKLVERDRRVIPEKGYYSSSGGTIISNATDVSIWLEMIHGHGVYHGNVFLEPTTIETFFKKPSNAKIIFGGLHIREADESGNPVLLGHSGSTGTDCWIDFAHDLIGVVLTQSGSAAAKPIAQRTRRDALEWVTREYAGR